MFQDINFFGQETTFNRDAITMEGGGTLRLTNTSFAEFGLNFSAFSAVKVTDGSLRVQSSTFLGNAGSRGGAIQVFGGDAKIIRSTFSNNHALNDGGTHLILDSDFTDNFATQPEGFSDESGGAVPIEGGEVQ